MDIKAQRRAIDAIDDEITALLAKRFTLAEAIAAKKQKNAVPPIDEAREAEIMAKAAQTLGEADAETIFRAILEVSHRRQKESL